MNVDGIVSDTFADFAGPGGVGSSQPYRPPDPSTLPPMPFGLPFIARPGQEGFDQYGRMSGSLRVFRQLRVR